MLDRHRDQLNHHGHGISAALHRASSQHHEVISALYESPTGLLRFQHPYWSRSNPTSLPVHFLAEKRLRDMWDDLKVFLKSHQQIEVQQLFLEVAQNLREQTY
ncbi:unannotated protein [freshwater metagenome]|uniref:Unannotated protein n=1 Tax=freshwater metagenome TaxID=449393 RepID=A0A6J7SRE2_9ZZZZ